MRLEVLNGSIAIWAARAGLGHFQAAGLRVAGFMGLRDEESAGMQPLCSRA